MVVWSYSMEALNKESEFAAPVLTLAQKRSDLRENSMVGKFVRSSLQGLNHGDVLSFWNWRQKLSPIAKVMHVHPLTGFMRSWKQCCMIPSFICYLEKHFTFTVRFLKLTKTRKLLGTFYFIQKRMLWPGGGGTPYNGLYGKAPPERGTFFRLQVYKRVGILQVEVYKRVGKSVL